MLPKLKYFLGVLPSVVNRLFVAIDLLIEASPCGHSPHHWAMVIAPACALQNNIAFESIDGFVESSNSILSDRTVTISNCQCPALELVQPGTKTDIFPWLKLIF